MTLSLSLLSSDKDCLTVISRIICGALVWTMLWADAWFLACVPCSLSRQGGCSTVLQSCRYYTLKSVIKLLQQKTVNGADGGKAQQGGEHSAGADCSISAVTDVLMHANPDMEEDGAGSQPWCGGDAAQGQKGALSSRERRKRKRKEVRPAVTD